MSKGDLVFVYYPPAFMKLVDTLRREHKDLFAKVGWSLAHDHDNAFEVLNKELEAICIPEMGVEACCVRWLQLLEKRPKHPQEPRPSAALLERHPEMLEVWKEDSRITEVLDPFDSTVIRKGEH